MKPVNLPIVNIDRRSKSAIVESQNGKFPVQMEMPNWKIQDVQYGDDAVVVKSAVTGEWLMIDYVISTPANFGIHNSYQTNIDDMILDERGVPYE